MSSLTVKGLTVVFGAATALSEIDLSLEVGQVHALIGPNGAGKTTLVNAVTGVVRTRVGRVHLGDRDVTGWRPARLARYGVGRTFQHPQLFAALTPREHLAVVRRSKHRTVSEKAQAVTAEIVATILEQLPDDSARRLTFGHQRLLELARVAALAPDVLFVDEPVSGLDQAERDTMKDLIGSLSTVSAVCLIEHDMRVVADLATAVTVLDQGRVIASGPPSVLATDDRVRAAYLGGESLAAG